MKLFSVIFLAVTFSACGQSVNVVDTDELLESISPESDSLTIVNFWATWCKPCIAEMPHFVAYAKEHPDVHFLFVSLDFAEDVAKVEQFIKVKDLPGRQLLMKNLDYNQWLPKVDSEWEGNIPFTLIHYKGKSVSRAGSFSSEEELLQTINQLKKSSL